MKSLAIFLLCAVITIHALPRTRAPIFEVHDGILVRSGRDSSTGKIVGGGDADTFSAPWIVSLQWGTIRPSHFCAGSIINSNWILTAAHCTLSYPTYGIRTVVAGLHDLDEFNGEEQIRHVTLSNTWTHDDYDGSIGPHDISLLLFQTPFTFGDTVSPIALPDADEIHTGVATLHGWGSISNTLLPIFPNILQTADLPIIPLDTCRSLWPLPIDDNHICAGYTGLTACQLDDGGALVQNGEVIGIVSWGVLPCGIQDRPAIYVRVSAYISWINDIISSV